METICWLMHFYTFEDLNPHVLACYLYHSNETLPINEIKKNTFKKVYIYIIEWPIPDLITMMQEQ